MTLKLASARPAFLAAAGLMLLAAEAAYSQDTGPTTRQPIVTNQFTTTSGGALQQRRPGIWVQNGMAVQAGTLTIPGDAQPEPRSWYLDTLEQIFQAILDELTAFLQTLNLANIFGEAAAVSPAQAGLALPPDDGSQFGPALTPPVLAAPAP